MTEQNTSPWFGPDRTIKQFDCRNLIGKTVTLKVTSREVTKEEIFVRATAPWFAQTKVIHSLSDWIPIPQDCLNQNDEVELAIEDCYLMQRMNGGRSDTDCYYTYKDYYCQERREKLEAEWAGGLMYSIMSGGGDNNKADLIIRLERGLVFEESLWSFDPPEEWYSEHHKSNPSLRFADGFYPDAIVAADIFRKKAHDDMFGERYFPVLAFNKSLEDAEKIREVAAYAKGHSGLIETDDYLVMGTRCKPYEFEEVIARTYMSGGRVPIGVEWSWD